MYITTFIPASRLCQPQVSINLNYVPILNNILLCNSEAYVNLKCLLVSQEYVNLKFVVTSSLCQPTLHWSVSVPSIQFDITMFMSA